MCTCPECAGHSYVQEKLVVLSDMQTGIEDGPESSEWVGCCTAGGSKDSYSWLGIRALLESSAHKDTSQLKWRD